MAVGQGGLSRLCRGVNIAANLRHVLQLSDDFVALPADFSGEVVVVEMIPTEILILEICSGEETIFQIKCSHGFGQGTVEKLTVIVRCPEHLDERPGGVLLDGEGEEAEHLVGILDALQTIKTGHDLLAGEMALI